MSHIQEESNSQQSSRLVSLPYEIRLQIWQYAIPIETELCFCPCIDHPARASESETCVCHQNASSTSDKTPTPDMTQETSKALQLSMSAGLLDEACANTPPSLAFLHNKSALLSSLPLTCRRIYDDTLSLTQPEKHLKLCGPACLASLLTPLKPHELSMISQITVAIDLRVFRPPSESGELASFHDIWKCIYNTRNASDRAVRKFFSSPHVDRMNAAVIEPALDFYPLKIECGKTFDRQELEFSTFWQRSTADERVQELRRIVGNRSREGLPVPGRWRARAGADGTGIGAVARMGGSGVGY